MRKASSTWRAVLSRPEARCFASSRSCASAQGLRGLPGRENLHTKPAKPPLLARWDRLTNQRLPTSGFSRTASNDARKGNKPDNGDRKNPVEPPLRPSQAIPSPDGTPQMVSSNQSSQSPSVPLPSDHLSRRSNLAAKFHRSSESLLNSLAQVSQRVNTYTGTDYSGISALRNSIIAQEKLVRARHAAVNEAKETHAAAIAEQSRSNREVVKLLERKNSWSEGDLEHYMGLVRSEHANEQAVQAASDNHAEAERSLEEARVKLEKIERQQYHEEQIWSDTIRRNSTWVTFGLMGLNIFLLLASLVAIEPWRRRRLVREIRKALDERSISSHPEGPVVESDALVQLAGVTSESASIPEASPSSSIEGAVAVGPTSQVTPEAKSDEAPGDATASTQHSAAAGAEVLPERQSVFSNSRFSADTWSGTFALWRALWADLFSERRIVLTRVDLTTATLEGAAAGAAIMGLMFVLLRPR